MGLSRGTVQWSLVASAALFAVGAMVLSFLRADPAREAGRYAFSSPSESMRDTSCPSWKSPQSPDETVGGGLARVAQGDRAETFRTGPAPAAWAAEGDPVDGALPAGSGEAAPATSDPFQPRGAFRDTEPFGPRQTNLEDSRVSGSLLGMIPKVGTRVDSRDMERDTLTVEASPEPAKREKEFYEAFRAMQKAEPEILERSATEVLQSTEPDCKKVALLRALCDTRPETAVDHLTHAVADLPEGTEIGHESVPSFALRLLTERSVSDQKSRVALESLLWSGTPLAADRRIRAAAALYANAGADELYRLTPFLSGERDPAVLAAAAAGLAANSADPTWAKRVLDSLDLPLPATEPVPSPDE